MEAPGVAETQQGLHDLARTRVFLVNLLIHTTFDADTNFSRMLRRPPKFTEFLEVLWRPGIFSSRFQLSRSSLPPELDDLPRRAAESDEDSTWQNADT
jgi:hypothetical protein